MLNGGKIKVSKISTTILIGQISCFSHWVFTKSIRIPRINSSKNGMVNSINPLRDKTQNGILESNINSENLQTHDSLPKPLYFRRKTHRKIIQ